MKSTQKLLRASFLPLKQERSSQTEFLLLSHSMVLLDLTPKFQSLLFAEQRNTIRREASLTQSIEAENLTAVKRVDQAPIKTVLKKSFRLSQKTTQLLQLFLSAALFMTSLRFK